MKAILTVTDLNNAVIWQSRELDKGGVNCMQQLSVYPTIRRQHFQGFGGAFTEASAYNYRKLPEKKQKEFMEAYFGETGLRYNVGRAHINSCDFALGNYACMESLDDPVFHTDRDEKYLIPMILEAQKTANKPIGLLLSPWSPPAFMKTNGEMNHGGRLKPEYGCLWARCMAKYVAFYREKGCKIDMISIQNEPAATQTWDSCLYSGREEGMFAPILRAALDAEGCGDVQILVWDHNKDVMVYRITDTMSAPGADRAVDGIAIHWYTGSHFDAVRLTKEQWPDKSIWFTEGCVEYSRFDGMNPMQKAEMYAHDILGNLNAGICGSIDWNLLLDAKGGPNHVGNFCEAPMMLNAEASDFERMSEYWYIGHFSRYIQPGAVCLGSSIYSTDVEATVFENPDGSRVAVVLNANDTSRFVSLTDNGIDGYSFTLAPHSIATLQW